MAVTYAEWFNIVTAALLAFSGFWLRRLYADVDSARAEIQRLREEVAARMADMIDKTTFDRHIDAEKVSTQDIRTELRTEIREVGGKLDTLQALLVKVQIQIAGLRGPQRNGEGG